MAGYLFVHFIGEQENGEQIYFSVSKDGLHWHDLNAGRPVLYSETGTCGVRDPFLVRSPLDKKFYLIATDLRIASGNGWGAAQEEGSRDLIVWESEDLVHWSKERACTVGIPEAGCVWAPEAVFDRERQEFFVFFASNVQAEGEQKRKQRIYAAYTKDFHEFSETFLYMERENHVIDTTILEDCGHYYRISKDETTKRLILESADSLRGEFVKIDSQVLEQLEGVEGPEGYLLPDKKTWCLIADQFAAGKGYLPMTTQNLSSGEFEILSPEQYNMGKVKKRHGGVLEITDKEYDKLCDYFDRENPVVQGLFADPDLYYENGTYYIYPTTDGYEGWSGHEFSVFSSQDTKDFNKGTAILDVATEQVPWAVGSAWAPCIAKKGEKYYYYFCAKNEQGISCIGAAVGDSPTGPFEAMPEPMVTMDMMREYNIKMGQTIDPSVYMEGDTAYLFFGNGEAAVARLSEDMLHIECDTLKNLEGLTDFRESVIVTKKEDIYYFTWSCDDTGSENYHVNYGVSKSLYGPVEFKGVLLQKDVKRDILGTGHHSILKLSEDKYYIAYHRFGTPLEKYPEGKGWHREVCLAPLEFDKEGNIYPIVTV